MIDNVLFKVSTLYVCFDEFKPRFKLVKTKNQDNKEKEEITIVKHFFPHLLHKYVTTRIVRQINDKINPM